MRSKRDGSFCFRARKETSETLGEQMLPTLCAGIRLVRYKKKVLALEQEVQDKYRLEMHNGGGRAFWFESLIGWADFFSVSDAYPRNNGRKKICLS